MQSRIFLLHCAVRGGKVGIVSPLRGVFLCPQRAGSCKSSHLLPVKLSGITASKTWEKPAARSLFWKSQETIIKEKSPPTENCRRACCNMMNMEMYGSQRTGTQRVSPPPPTPAPRRRCGTPHRRCRGCGGLPARRSAHRDSPSARRRGCLRPAWRKSRRIRRRPG